MRNNKYIKEIIKVVLNIKTAIVLLCFQSKQTHTLIEVYL